jgi:GNAT superfamily N-acetyltransferase
MVDQVEVRFATRTDMDGCIALDHPMVPAEVIKRKIEQSEIIVAEEAGRLVGYLRLEYLWSVVPYIGLIWVVGDQRRQGIGRAMLHVLEDIPHNILNPAKILP